MAGKTTPHHRVKSPGVRIADVAVSPSCNRAGWEDAHGKYSRAFVDLIAAGGTSDTNWNQLAMAHDAAMWSLFHTPAPDMTAFADKLAIAFAPETDLDGISSAGMARALLLEDVQRLASR